MEKDELIYCFCLLNTLFKLIVLKFEQYAKFLNYVHNSKSQHASTGSNASSACSPSEDSWVLPTAFVPLVSTPCSEWAVHAPYPWLVRTRDLPSPSDRIRCTLPFPRGFILHTCSGLSFGQCTCLSPFPSSTCSCLRSPEVLVLPGSLAAVLLLAEMFWATSRCSCHIGGMQTPRR